MVYNTLYTHRSVCSRDGGWETRDRVETGDSGDANFTVDIYAPSSYTEAK